MELQLKMNLPCEADIIKTCLDWLGNQLFAVKNNFDSKAYIIDVGTGKILWVLDNCFNGGGGQCIGDEKAVYIARELRGKRFMTAHKPETGEEIWNCYLSTSPYQFATSLLQNEKYLFHSNLTQIFVVEKATGKLVNKFKGAYANAEGGGMLTWKDKLLYAGWIESGKGKNKQTSLVLSLYDPLSKDNAFIEDIITISGRLEIKYMELLNDNMLFLLTREDAIMRIINLDTKQVYFEHDFVPNGDQTMVGYEQGYMSQIAHDGDKFHFMVKATEIEINEEEDNYINHRYFSTLDLKKKTLDSIDEAGVSYYQHYYYDGKLVYTGFNTFKPDDPKKKEDTGIDKKNILSMEVIDDKFYLLQDNKNRTVNIIVLKK